MSAPGLHRVLQEATGCAMDTERDWVAQLEAHSYTVQAVSLGEAVTEEIQTLAQKSNKCSWGVVLFAQDRGEPAWVVLSAGGYARSTADWPRSGFLRVVIFESCRLLKPDRVPRSGGVALLGNRTQQ